MSSIFETFSSPVDISVGKVGGAVPITITGVNPDIDIGEIETLWQHGGRYIPLTSSENVYIVSTSTLDLANTFILDLLQFDFTLKRLPATPNGRTPVLVSGGTYFRFNRAINLSGVASKGDIYIYSGEGGATNGVPNVASKIMAKIPIGKEISQNGLYTVPKGQLFVANKVRLYLGKNKDCDVSIYVYTPYNTAPFELIAYQLFQLALEDDFRSPPPYIEGTTFEFRVSSENNNTRITANASGLLIGLEG